MILNELLMMSVVFVVDNKMKDTSNNQWEEVDLGSVIANLFHTVNNCLKVIDQKTDKQENTPITELHKKFYSGYGGDEDYVFCNQNMRYVMLMVSLAMPVDHILAKDKTEIDALGLNKLLKNDNEGFEWNKEVISENPNLGNNITYIDFLTDIAQCIQHGDVKYTTDVKYFKFDNIIIKDDCLVKICQSTALIAIKHKFSFENYLQKENKELKEKNEEINKLNDQLAEKNKALEEAQQKLQEKNQELNNLVAMFAHNFLGTLQCIRSNAEHENNPTIHLKTVKMMGGALTVFSILSADDDKLVDLLKQDNAGEMNLQQNLANNLTLAISQLLGKSNKDKIVNLYLQHLRKTKQVGIETSSEELRVNRDYRKMWQALQHQWEDEFNALFSEHVELPLLQKWLTENFFPVEITGFDSHNISFREYGITDSIFLIVFMEIFVNAFKYMDVSKNKPLTLKLCEEDQCYKLVCENPSTQETGRGTHKGRDFLKTIAKKLGGQFITEATGNSFKSTFAIPSELLK
ncbi:MAG: hypothetical protein D4R63_10445 [Methylococcaceae bacterium]|nr:MAG: hypothetical protein D4R63_10445 [Methylococcaceae bacterium]